MLRAILVAQHPVNDAVRLRKRRRTEEDCQDDDGSLPPKTQRTDWSPAALVVLARHVDGGARACHDNPRAVGVSAVKKTYSKAGNLPDTFPKNIGTYLLASLSCLTCTCVATMLLSLHLVFLMSTCQVLGACSDANLALRNGLLQVACGDAEIKMDATIRFLEIVAGIGKTEMFATNQATTYGKKGFGYSSSAESCHKETHC